jgi:hypothetical protein
MLKSKRAMGLSDKTLYADLRDSDLQKTYSTFIRGLHPERGDRLIFQLRYGLRDNEISGAGCAS